MKKGGLTEANVREKIRKCKGNLAAVARAFGVTRQSVWDFVQTRPELKAAADDVREAMKDEAENSLQKAVAKGEAWAVCFYLKTQARDRGYVEKQDIDVTTGGKPVGVREIIVRTREEAKAMLDLLKQEEALV